MKPEEELSRYCRTCLSECHDSTDTLHPILDGSNFGVILAQLTSVQVKHDDLFAKNICSECRSRVLEFLEFKQICIASQQYLASRQRFQQMLAQATVAANNPTVAANSPIIASIQNNDMKKEKLDRNESLTTFFQPPEVHEQRPDPKFDEFFDQPFTPLTQSQVLTEHLQNDAFFKSLQLIKRTKHTTPKQTTHRKMFCDVCKKFVCSSNKKKHLATHMTYPCKVNSCDFVATSTFLLNKHIAQKHVDDDSTTKYSCEYCSRDFYFEIEYEKHLRNEKKGGLCKICKKFIDHCLIQHVRKDHTAEEMRAVFKCNICQPSTTFTSEAQFKHHKQTHLNEKVICDVCGLTFPHRTIKSHKKSHKPEQGDASTSNTNDTTTESKKYDCQFCNEHFDSRTKLWAHVRMRHAQEEHEKRKFLCPSCPSKFLTQKQLLQHDRRSHKAKPVTCLVCKREFKQTDKLKRHMRVHTGERPYACDLCDQSFKDKAILKDHRVTHTGERPHVCVVCHRGFTQRSALTAHQRSHLKY